MKKFLSFSMIFVLLISSFVFCVSAEENDISKFELPAPKAPNYFVYTDGDASEGSHDDLRMIMIADPEVALFAAEYSRDSEAFYEKYGLYSFNIVMQYDVSLDSEDSWQHNEEWDTNWSTSGYADGYPYVSLNSKMMEDFEFFWLTYYEGPDSNTFVPYKPAIITEKFVGDGYENDIYSFDVENHSLYIRCRYYMEWEPLVKNEYGEGPGEKQSKFSDWSESAIFGKNSTQIVPDEPTTYEAPIISDLRILPPSENNDYFDVRYIQETPESVWNANVYYMMIGSGEFYGLETQISIDGSDWFDATTVDSGSDWSLWNGERFVNFEGIEDISYETNLKIRIRFIGTHGPSKWSDVLEINARECGNGDINGNGIVDADDYILLKRAYFGTYKLSEEAKINGDVNGNGKIDADDYILLKRAYFGTYKIG